MKKFILFILAILPGICSISAQELTMRNVFKQMPDSLMPYLSHNSRLDMIDFIDSGMKAEVSNAFDKHSWLDSITSNYMKLHLSAASSIEMKLLPAATVTTDTCKQILCVVVTYGEQPIESIVRFYTAKWNSVDIANPLKENKLRLVAVRPDTISDSEYNKLIALTDNLMTVAHLSPSENTLTVSATMPMLSADDKTLLAPHLIATTFKWNGKSFK